MHLTAGTRRILLRLTGAVLLSIRFAYALGQASTSPAFRISTDLIQVPVLALRPPFRVATGLDLNTFIVRLDDGPSFHPRYLRVEGSEPIDLSIVAETDSNHAEDLSSALQSAFRRWPTDLLLDTDRLSFYVSGCRIMRFLEQIPAVFGSGRDVFVQAASFSTFQKVIDATGTCRPTSEEALLRAVMQQSVEASRWKVILLILNGERTLDSAKIASLQSTAAVRGIALFAVKYVRQGSFPKAAYNDKEGLTLLVSSLGGISVVSSFADLGGVIETLIRDIRQRYILSFQRPGNGQPGPHRMEITAAVRGIQVRASAASAMPIDESAYKDGSPGPGSQQRPMYGTSRPPE